MPLGAADLTPVFGVVVIGASAGGIRALSTVLASLPDPFPVGIALVLHLSRDRASLLTQVLSRKTRRDVEWAREGLPMRAGVIYAAPPDRHLEFDAHGSTILGTSAPVHFARPSVDRLFTSAAAAYGPRTLAILLSGNGSDGATGAVTVRAAGGVVIAQDEESSEYFSMPHEAIGRGAVAYVLPLDGIASAATSLVRSGVAAHDTAWSPRPRPTDTLDGRP